MWNKVIFQSYECGFDELHEQFKENCMTWKNIYPSWKYHFSNAKERKNEVINILKLSPIQIVVYDCHQGLIQSDIWRYVMTGFHGGMWADLDSIATSSIEPVINELDNYIEMIALPNGTGSLRRVSGLGSNNSNFIVKQSSSISRLFLKTVKQYFIDIEKSLVLFGGKSPRLEQMKTLDFFVQISIDHNYKIAQIFDNKYTNHSLDFKAPWEYRKIYEKEQNAFYECCSSFKLK